MKNLGPGPIGQLGGEVDQDLRKKFLKKVADNGNIRYAASTTSSLCGGLITGLHTRNGFYVKEEDVPKYIEFNKTGILLDQPEQYDEYRENEE